MAFRFRKSFKIAPGVRLNVSKSGLSGTFGPKGASVNVGKRGVYANASIPGTGLSMRQKIAGGSTARTTEAASRAGRVSLLDANTSAPPPLPMERPQSSRGARVAWTIAIIAAGLFFLAWIIPAAPS